MTSPQNIDQTTPHRETHPVQVRSLETRMPGLWSLLVGPDADAEERLKAAIIRAGALKDLQEAQRRRDTRKAHEKGKDAIQATGRALEVGA